ncbi:MDR family MFS transporter [Leucobacter komagatae]|uniref:MDR family MFS transporter n=1 Tax=Leucobacter komagatae TaxID=55969 RepID=UPI0005AD06FF|nr:MDR family MFS transporter [Leucobacter komagatae]
MTPQQADTSPTPTPRTITAVIAILAISAFVMILNETVLSVALPPLMAEFGVGATTIQWLTTGFLLTMAVVIPTTGYLLSRFSIRTLFIAALILFLLGTALAAVAPSFGIMLLARVIQACGTAIVMPLLMTTTLTLVPPQHRGTVMGLNSIVISVGPAIGPTLSGVVIEALSWRWVFGLMVPVAMIALTIGLFLMPRLGGGKRVPLDLPSVALSVLGFGGVITAVSSAAELTRGSLVPPIAFAVGVAALVIFTRRQKSLQANGDAALLDLRPFGQRNFRLSVTVLTVAFGVMLGTVVVLPIYAQSGLGLTVLATGLIMLPGGIAQGVLAPIVGRLYDVFGPKPLVIPGVLVLCGAQWWLSTISADTTSGQLIAMHVTFSVGMALVQTPMMTHAMSSLPLPLYGHGSAILNTLQQLAGAAGTAALIGALAIGASMSGLADPAAQIAGAKLAFAVGGSIIVIAVVCAPFVTRHAREASAATSS